MSFPMVALGEVIKHRNQFIQIDDLQNYKRCRVRLHAQGIVLRDIVLGAEIKTKKQQVCQTGEFLVAEIDAKIGGFGIVPPELDDSIVSSHYFLFVIDETRLDRRFLDFFIRTPYFREQVTAQGTTNYAAIRPANVLGYKIPFLPLPEQRRIVAHIEELAAKIEEAQGLRKKAEEEAKKICSSKILNIFNENNFPVKILKDIVSNDKYSIKRGPFGSSLRKEFFVPLGFKVYEQKNVINDDFSIGNYYIDSNKFEELKAFQIRPNDILISCSGTIGKVAIVPANVEEGIINQALLKLSLNESIVLNDFFKVIFESNLTQQKLVTPGSAMKNVSSVKHLKEVSFPIPSIDEQHSILAYIDSLRGKVDALRRLQAETGAEMDALMPAVLDRAFKGEL